MKRAIIVLAAISLFSFSACKKVENNPTPAPAAPAAEAAAVPAAVTVDAAKSLVLQLNALPMKAATEAAKSNAKVTIVEFSDYECPFCSRAEPTIAEIMKKYPNDVRVAFINNPLPMHKNAEGAAKAALAAQRQGKFWEMHEALFANQRGLNEEFYTKKAAELGLDAAKFAADMNDPAIKSLIDKGMKDGGAYGISGTPSFLINGVLLVGAQPANAFSKVIDEQLARANKVAGEKNLSGDALYEELVKTAPKPAPEPEEDEAPTGRVHVDLTNAPILGNADAPVTIVEFTDFQCPFCSRANKTLHELLNANPDKVRIVFRHYPLPFHDKAKLAHQAAEAAKMQGKFWEYYDKLFDNQNALDRDSLIKHAKDLGLDEAKFVADMDSPAVAAVVEADLKAGSEAGVRGTPHFFLNGTLLSGAQPLAAFQGALDKELDAAKPYMDKGLKGTALYEQVIKDNKPAPLVVDIAGSPFKGAADAPVTIVQFSDFQCPFCSRVEPTIDQLMADPAYAGKIKVVFKQLPLPFHDKAQKAAEAALFANANGKFWEMHKKMFANQNALDIENLKKYATEIGLDAAALEAALNSDQYKAAVEADAAAAAGVKISGTPSFVINGKSLVGAQPIEKFKEAIDAALKEAGK
ncbi:MAG: thioredoxin domain-containing protein [Proteobacteria bacterium]|nr:thioredoxin domain-containing protein [Pseudomonadota bacterium]